MKRSLYLLIIGVLVLTSYTSNPEAKHYRSDTLEVYPLTENTFVHVSYLDIPNYGRFACNGLIYKVNNEAIIFDTPTTDSVSIELISWVQNELKCKIKAIVVNHFHDDCLGGLNAFHKAGIKSYANDSTIKKAIEFHFPVPETGFNDSLILTLGGEVIINSFPGAGHTRDNIISYIPKEKVLFGGCLIKELNAKKGYLGDADLKAWPETIANIKKQYPDVQFVVPGHGKPGNTELLDYTIELFSAR